MYFNNVKLNAVRRKDKANPLRLLYWNRELLYYLHLFQFVCTVVLTDYFMLMVVLMVVHIFWPAKGSTGSVVAPDLKSATQTGWLVFKRFGVCRIFSEVLLMDTW